MRPDSYIVIIMVCLSMHTYSQSSVYEMPIDNPTKLPSMYIKLEEQDMINPTGMHYYDSYNETSTNGNVYQGDNHSYSVYASKQDYYYSNCFKRYLTEYLLRRDIEKYGSVRMRIVYQKYLNTGIMWLLSASHSIIATEVELDIFDLNGNLIATYSGTAFYEIRGRKRNQVNEPRIESVKAAIVNLNSNIMSDREELEKVLLTQKLTTNKNP